jgi:hypothetical protein
MLKPARSRLICITLTPSCFAMPSVVSRSTGLGANAVAGPSAADVVTTKWVIGISILAAINISLMPLAPSENDSCGEHSIGFGLANTTSFRRARMTTGISDMLIASIAFAITLIGFALILEDA